jgi:hypothetical protein
VGKRSARFLGSQMWRNRDVSLSQNADKLTARDKVSGITVTRSAEQSDVIAVSYLLQELAHRVHQFE